MRSLIFQLKLFLHNYFPIMIIDQIDTMNTSCRIRTQQQSENIADSLESGGSGMGGNTATSLVWEDVTVVASSKKLIMRNINNNKGASSCKKLLTTVSGYAVPYRIMAIMGPSGSGKSTLLDALAGRLPPNLMMAGNVLLNGKQRSIGCRAISYVTQDDFLLGTLTVKETLTYSAHLRLSGTMTKDEIDCAVQNSMMKLGLQDCADTKIGNWHLRGISNGEKRRLSISLEMLTQPSVMFLDEPTTGLDSASAFFVVEALKNVAVDGRIVVCSVHQPSSYVFDLFDDLCLLSSGEAVYFGEAKLAVKFFADAGFPCPVKRSPSDHFLRCINSDFDKKLATMLWSRRDFSETPGSLKNSETNLSTAQMKEMLIEKYRNSDYSVSTRKRIREFKLVNGELVAAGLDKKDRSGWKQLCTLTKRSFVNMTRDLGYFWIRIVFIILICLGAGIMFFDIGLSHSAFVSRAKCYTLIFNFLICLSVGGLPSIAEEWKVVIYEKSNGHYGEAVFVLSNLLSSVPFLVIISVASGPIIHYMVKFHMGIEHLIYLCIDLFCCITLAESVAMIVALLVPTFLMGIGVSAAVIMFLTIASGLYRPLPDLPKILWRYPMTYISFTSWAVEGQYKNDMIGLEFEPLVPGDPKIRGEEVLQTILGVQLNISKWWDLAALFLLLFCHRIAFFLLLKYRTKATVLLHGVYARITSQHIANIPSFRRDHYPSSRRHKPPHPLSSQEGLASPLH